MKKILFFAVSFLFFGIVSHAQTPSTAPASSAQPISTKQKNKKADKTNKGNRLNMTSDQRKEMHQINEVKQEKKQSIMANNNLSNAQKKEQMKTLGKQTRSQKNKVYTPNQRDQKAQMNGAKKATKQESKVGKKAGGHTKRLGSLQ